MPTISIRQTIYLFIIVPLVLAIGATGTCIFIAGRQIVHHVEKELSQEVAEHIVIYTNDYLENNHSTDISNFTNFLRKFKNSRSLEAFIINRQGNMIASSANLNAEKTRIVKAINSSEPIVKSTAKHILQQFNNFTQIKEQVYFTFDIAGKRQLVQIIPLQNHQSSDWLVVVAIPESNFIAPVYRYIKIIVLLGLGLTVLATFCALKIARWIVEPIDIFDQATKDIEQEIYEPQILDAIASRQDELGKLGRAFQSMSTVVNQRESDLKQEVEKLKQDREQVNQSPITTRLKIDRWQQSMIHSQRKRSINPTTSKKLNYQLQSSARITTPQIDEIDLLRQIPYLQNLDQLELEQLIEQGDYFKLSAAQYVYLAKDKPADRLYLILSGEVAISLDQAQKPLTTLDFGEMFGEISLIFNTPRLFTVTTLAPTSLLSFSGDRLWKILTKHPEISEYIIRNVTENKMSVYNLKQLLRQHKLLNYSFQSNPANWIRSRLKSLID